MSGRKVLYALVAVVLLAGIAFPADPTSTLKAALKDLCISVKGLVPVAAMLMILLASVIYATGQMMGAETRARANVWATSCITGALIGILISQVAPVILGTILGSGTLIC